MFWYPVESVDSWTNCTLPVSATESPARNYSLNMRKQKKANLAWRTSQTSIQETGADSLSGRRRSGKLFLPIHRGFPNGYKTGCVIMIKKNDNLMQQLYWDTTRPILLKAFANRGAQDFSEKYWLRLIHEGSSKTRFEYCEDSKNSLAFFRAIQDTLVE